MFEGEGGKVEVVARVSNLPTTPPSVFDTPETVLPTMPVPVFATPVTPLFWSLFMLAVVGVVVASR